MLQSVLRVSRPAARVLSSASSVSSTCMIRPASSSALSMSSRSMSYLVDPDHRPRNDPNYVKVVENSGPEPFVFGRPPHPHFRFYDFVIGSTVLVAAVLSVILYKPDTPKPQTSKWAPANTK